jgi:hypothetical protein
LSGTRKFEIETFGSILYKLTNLFLNTVVGNAGGQLAPGLFYPLAPFVTLQGILRR